MFKLEIKTGNADFKDPCTGEDDDCIEALVIGDLLSRVSLELMDGEKSGTIMDSNGNKVGSWKR